VSSSPWFNSLVRCLLGLCLGLLDISDLFLESRSELGDLDNTEWYIWSVGSFWDFFEKSRHLESRECRRRLGLLVLSGVYLGCALVYLMSPTFFGIEVRARGFGQYQVVYLIRVVLLGLFRKTRRLESRECRRHLSLLVLSGVYLGCALVYLMSPTFFGIEVRARVLEE
jgi:hypothetical protein